MKKIVLALVLAFAFPVNAEKLEDAWRATEDAVRASEDALSVKKDAERVSEDIELRAEANTERAMKDALREK